MTMRSEDMSEVAKPGDVVPEGWYKGRIAKVEETESKESGEPTLKIWLKIQSEGPAFGRTITDFASLQKQALFKLKGYYEAVNYHPPKGQHDPDQIVDGEIYFHISHEVYRGENRTKVDPWSLRSITQGPGQGATAKTA